MHLGVLIIIIIHRQGLEGIHTESYETLQRVCATVIAAGEVGEKELITSVFRPAMEAAAFGFSVPSYSITT